MEMFELNPVEIKVKEELPRIRKEMNKIEKLAESFSRFGQLQPIIINRNYELIAGGRRLAACMISGRKAKCIFADTLDPLTMREMELEENLQRENLTPAEEVLAIDEIHRIKQQIHGVPKSYPGQKGGWRVEDTAELIGRTQPSITDDLALAEFIKLFPALSDAKTKSEIRKAAKGLTKVSQRIDAIKDYEEILGKDASKFDVTQNDAREHMLTIPDKSIDLLFTDPPWGIDIDKNAIGVGGRTGEFTTTGIKYSDSKTEAMEIYSILGKEAIRFCRENAHAYVFVAPEHFNLIREIWISFGWFVSPRPIIWIKGTTGQNNAPYAWPSPGYESIMFARRHESRLVIEGKVDWIQALPVPPSERLHPAEKPISLIKDLMLRTSMPSHKMYDPFMGSGASVEVALEMKMFPIACDNDIASYSATIQRIVEWERRKK